MSEVDTTPVDEAPAESETSGSEPATDEVKDTHFFNPHAGLRGRPGGVYLDEEERREAELHRAAREKREPDFENLPAVAGTPLVTQPMLVDNSVNSNPASSQVMAHQEPVTTLPVDYSEVPVDVDTGYAEQVNEEDNVRGTNTDVTGAGPATEVDDSTHDGTAANVLAAQDAGTGPTEAPVVEGGNETPDDAAVNDSPESSNFA